MDEVIRRQAVGGHGVLGQHRLAAFEGDIDDLVLAEGSQAGGELIADLCGRPADFFALPERQDGDA